MKQSHPVKTPPSSADVLLEWYCDPFFLEEVQGDLYELFENRAESIGGRKAQIWYWLDVLRFFRPYLLTRRLLASNFGGSGMFSNYFKIAFRNLLRNKGYSFINISGLVVGLVACILILLFVQDELSYDTFHKKAGRIYRITSEELKDSGMQHTAYNYAPIRPLLLNDFSEIEDVVRLFPKSVVVQLDQERRFQEEKFFFADSTFFDVFSFPFKLGDQAQALNAPYDIVITEPVARKYFGAENPIGKTLIIENNYDFRVTGVLEEVPSNSHMQFDFIAAMGSIRDIEGWALRGWHYPPMYAYMLLPAGLPVSQIEAKLPPFIDKNIARFVSAERRLHLQPLTDIHLQSNLQGELGNGGDIAYVYIFTTTAFFILLIACINFMNLATARSAKRAREVGLRKVVGARRIQLIHQFYGESIFYACLALVLSVILVVYLLPSFNLLVGKNLDVSFSKNWDLLLGLLGLTAGVGLIAGSYPALFLSSFRPIKILRANAAAASGTAGHARFRAALVVLQFAISICLIINSSVIQKQLHFLQNKKLGFSKEQILIIPVRDDDLQNNWNSVKHRILANSNIVSVSATSTIPGIERDMDFPTSAEGISEDLNLQTMLVDHDFLKTFDMEIIDGRDFSRSFVTDSSTAFILNETAVQKIGWSESLGKSLSMKHVVDGQPKRGQVIGVVKDFHFRSLHHKIDPMLLQISPRAYYLDNIAIKLKTEDLSGTLAFIEQCWREFVPHRPVEYKFLDEVFEQVYLKEQKLSEVFNYFSYLAIFVGCLGLFGLASFIAEQRTKEIGVRKVLGASVLNIVVMMSKEFVQLIVVAFLIAAPAGYLMMRSWLQDFTYRVDLSLDTFLISGVGALAIALLTIAYQTLKAALSNPTNSLRFE